jgi:hypothetical protein
MGPFTADSTGQCRAEMSGQYWRKIQLHTDLCEAGRAEVDSVERQTRATSRERLLNRATMVLLSVLAANVRVGVSTNRFECSRE